MVNLDDPNHLIAVPLIGFVWAVFFGNLVAIISDAPDTYRYRFDSIATVIQSFSISLFAGPYLVYRSQMQSLSDGTFSVPIALISSVIILLWSFCAGVLIANGLMMYGLISL